MTKLEINKVLEQTYEKDFLTSIEFLLSHNKEYKKSEFYKNTKIPLAVLYEKFYTYQKSKESIFDEIEIMIDNFDVEVLVDKIVEFINELEKNDTVSRVLNDIVENFNYEKLEELGEEVQTRLSEFQNKQ